MPDFVLVLRTRNVWISALGRLDVTILHLKHPISYSNDPSAPHGHDVIASLGGMKTPNSTERLGFKITKTELVPFLKFLGFTAVMTMVYDIKR